MNIQSNVSIIKPGFPPRLISGLLKTTPGGFSFQAVDPTQTRDFTFAELHKVKFEGPQIIISKKGTLKRTVFVFSNPTPGVQTLTPVSSAKDLPDTLDATNIIEYQPLITDWKNYIANANIKIGGIGKPILMAVFFLVACLGWLFSPFISFTAIALFIFILFKF